MRGVFESRSKGQRTEGLQRYLELLRERDGVPDLGTNTLSRREECFAREVRIRDPKPPRSCPGSAS